MTDAREIAQWVEATLTGTGTHPDLASILKPTVTVWHNHDVGPPAQVKADFLAPHLEGVPGMIRKAVADYRDEAVETRVADDAIVHTRTMCCLMPDGSWLRVPQCWIFHLDDSAISRIDLYIDTAQSAVLAPLLAAAASSEKAA